MNSILANLLLYTQGSRWPTYSYILKVVGTKSSDPVFITVEIKARSDTNIRMRLAANGVRVTSCPGDFDAKYKGLQESLSWTPFFSFN